MSDTIARYRARKFEKRLKQCKHFVGISILGDDLGTCRAGVNYGEAFGTEPGIANRMPCFHVEDRKGRLPLPCSKLELPTREEVEADIREEDERIDAFLADLRANRCPLCKREVKLIQRGPWVYGDCGHRLYQGRVPKTAEPSQGER